MSRPITRRSGGTRLMSGISRARESTMARCTPWRVLWVATVSTGMARHLRFRTQPTSPPTIGSTSSSFVDDDEPQNASRPELGELQGGLDGSGNAGRDHPSDHGS